MHVFDHHEIQKFIESFLKHEMQTVENVIVDIDLSNFKTRILAECTGLSPGFFAILFFTQYVDIYTDLPNPTYFLIFAHMG